MPPWQPPVHSPVPIAAVAGGAVDLLRPRARPTRELAARLTALFRPAGVLLTDSGTSALQLALRGAIQATGERRVALPAYGCYDLATAAIGSGARVLLYDVSPTSLAPVQASLAAALDAGARTVVCASLYGLANDTPLCAGMAREAGALLVMDAAQAWATTAGGRPYAAGGSLGVLSFGRGKGYTGGGGGALIASDRLGLRILDQLAFPTGERRRGWDDWLRATLQWALARPSLYGIPASMPGLGLGATVYHAPRPPAPISTGAAAILCRTWRAAVREIAIRRRNAARLVAAVAGAPPLATPAQGSAPLPPLLRLPVLAHPAALGRVGEGAARRLGIARGYPRALCDLPELAGSIENPSAGFPGARLLAERLFTLPTHGMLAERDMNALERWIGSLAGELRVRAGATDALAAHV